MDRGTETIRVLNGGNIVYILRLPQVVKLLSRSLRLSVVHLASNINKEKSKRRITCVYDSNGNEEDNIKREWLYVKSDLCWFLLLCNLVALELLK